MAVSLQYSPDQAFSALHFTSILCNCHWWSSMFFQDTSKHSFKCILWRWNVSKHTNPHLSFQHIFPHAKSQFQRVQCLPHRTRGPDLALNMPEYKSMTAARLDHTTSAAPLDIDHFPSLISSVWSDALSHWWVGFLFIYLLWKLLKLYLCNIKNWARPRPDLCHHLCCLSPVFHLNWTVICFLHDKNKWHSIK